MRVFSYAEVIKAEMTKKGCVVDCKFLNDLFESSDVIRIHCMETKIVVGQIMALHVRVQFTPENIITECNITTKENHLEQMKKFNEMIGQVKVA